MKKLNLHAEYNKPFTYIIDEELSIGIYRTINKEHLKENDKTLLNNYNITYNTHYKIDDAVLVKAKLSNGSRIDFLITENVCFDNLAILSEHGFDGQFYDEFVEAFDMLETEQYDDDAWYGLDTYTDFTKPFSN
jgi:hypothetical protein